MLLKYAYIFHNAYNILLGKREGRDNWEDLGVDGKIILEWILRISGEEVWSGCIWLRRGTSGGIL
jgi:hypothetical protein